MNLHLVMIPYVGLRNPNLCLLGFAKNQILRDWLGDSRFVFCLGKPLNFLFVTFT